MVSKLVSQRQLQLFSKQVDPPPGQLVKQEVEHKVLRHFDLHMHGESCVVVLVFKLDHKKVSSIFFLPISSIFFSPIAGQSISTTVIFFRRPGENCLLRVKNMSSIFLNDAFLSYRRYTLITQGNICRKISVVVVVIRVIYLNK